MQVVDEIYTAVTHVEPWSAGTSRVPSTAFCCIYRMCLMRVTRKQMAWLLNHGDSPYIRAVGFLILRYTCPFVSTLRQM
jgi:pre-mRNA-splicing factor 38B